MHICYVITRGDDIGGAQVHVVELATWMRDRGNTVTVLSGPGAELPTRLHQRGIRAIEIPSLGRSIRPAADVKAVRELTQTLRLLRPDLVSLHSSKAGTLGRIAARRTGIPAVFTSHGWSFGPDVDLRSAGLNRLVERHLAPLADHIITVSEADKELAVRDLSLDPGRVTAIPNGMPPVPVRARNSKGSVRFVSVARFSDQKDHSTLLRAFARLTAHSLPALSLIGDGPLRSEYERLAVDVGIGDRVEFMGVRNDVADLLTESDVFVLISNWEGMPRSIIEAQRAGLATVATDVGGVSEIVDDGKTGLLVRRGDERHVAATMQRLVDDPLLIADLSRAARANYEQSFTLERTARSTSQVYNSVIATSATGEHRNRRDP